MISYCLLSLLPSIFILIPKSFCCFFAVSLSSLWFTLELFPSLRQGYTAPVLSPSTGMGNIMSKHLFMSFPYNLLIQIKYWKVTQHKSSSHDQYGLQGSRCFSFCTVFSAVRLNLNTHSVPELTTTTESWAHYVSFLPMLHSPTLSPKADNWTKMPGPASSGCPHHHLITSRNQ